MSLTEVLMNVALLLIGYFMRHRGVTLGVLPGPGPSLPETILKALPAWLPAILAAFPILAKWFPALQPAPISPPLPSPSPPDPVAVAGHLAELRSEMDALRQLRLNATLPGGAFGPPAADNAKAAK